MAPCNADLRTRGALIWRGDPRNGSEALANIAKSSGTVPSLVCRDACNSMKSQTARTYDSQVVFLRLLEEVAPWLMRPANAEEFFDAEDKIDLTRSKVGIDRLRFREDPPR